MKKLNVLPDNNDQEASDSVVGLGRFPKWLHRKMPQGGDLWKTQKIVSSHRLQTVCEEAKCPNLLECWSHKTATFLAMGKTCTRACGFCSIDFSANPKALEDDEPLRLAQSVKELGLRHVVITMVARDDLPDGGAEHLSKIVNKVREINSDVTIELLTSDFAGEFSSLDKILGATPEIFNHNIETVRSLTPKVRHRATYDRTLSILSYMRQKSPALKIKSGLMVGMGETENEVKETLRDLYQAGCDIVTIGHYLQPDRLKLRVKEFITPEQFEAYAEYGRSIGIKEVYSAPFVRSSYNAGEVYLKVNRRNRVRTGILFYPIVRKFNESETPVRLRTRSRNLIQSNSSVSSVVK